MTEVEETPYAWFLGGTLVLAHVGKEMVVPPPFAWIDHKWRCPAVHYHTVKPWLEANNIRNQVPRWQTLNLRLHDGRTPHDYQLEALKAWQGNGRWGSVVLPTGSGKTYLALRAIAETRCSTLVVVPTIDLLHQWYGRLENAFKLSIGVWYGLEKNVQPITVTTYPSAWAHGETLGNLFKLIIFDEIHHLPAPSWHEIALMSAAPYRLGLTATYPDSYDTLPITTSTTETENRIDLLEALVGPVLYRRTVDELSGKQLANYRTERIRVDLTPTERAAYDEALSIYTGYMREARLREKFGPNWWQELTRRSAYEQEARRAKVSELKLKEIVHQANMKMDVVDHLLREHLNLPILIFTAYNRFAYAIARRQLIPAITHQTKAAERKAILDGFRDRTYRAIVTSKVLNEGIDVPEAKVAVVLGGSSNAREYIQRLGRILRKKGNVEAILYEVIARNTIDEGMAQRRRQRVKYHISK